MERATNSPGVVSTFANVAGDANESDPRGNAFGHQIAEAHVRDPQKPISEIIKEHIERGRFLKADEDDPLYSLPESP